jgi:hypothetical protein
LEWQERLENSEIFWNEWNGLKITGNGKTFLDIVCIAGTGWRWLKTARNSWK